MDLVQLAKSVFNIPFSSLSINMYELIKHEVFS